MIFSYRIGDRWALNNIGVPVQGGRLTLLTGVENKLFGLLGGILAGLFPIEEQEPFPQIEDLIQDFTGSLKVTEGKLPETAIYLGPDPEKHLLFSRVDEEIFAQTGRKKELEQVLEAFCLQEMLLRRKISTLSGGEKMKLALSIAFSKSVDCLVLHGVLPWLDREGKLRLIAKLRGKLVEGRSVIVLEQEIDELKRIAHRTLYFNGSQIVRFDDRLHERSQVEMKEVSERIHTELGGMGESDEILRFKGVGFSYENRGTGDFALNAVSFTLHGSKVYGMVGDNGTGKSTIAKLILRVLKPQEGNIYFLGRALPLFKRGEIVKSVCYVGQFPEQHITLSTVEQYRTRARKMGNTLSEQMLGRLFPEEKSYPVSQLTPLQMKLVLLLSSIHADTRLVILDEPTWGVDRRGEIELLEVFFHILRKVKSLSLLIISHDIGYIERLNAEVLLVEHGSVSWFPRTDSYTDSSCGVST